MNKPRVILALDYGDESSVLSLVDQLDPTQCRLKIGKALFTRFGPGLVRQLIKRRFDIFLDLKFHDIPSTVANACQAAADLGVWMLNVHAMGGAAMLAAARKSLNAYTIDKPILIAVTVLTSMDEQQLHGIGVPETISQHVERLAYLTADNGLDGVVCSPHEIATLRKIFGEKFCLVTPGIRLPTADHDDQRRVMSPIQAIASGSDYLVIGRQITQAEQPLTVLRYINEVLQLNKR